MLSLWILTALVPLAAAQVGFEQWVSDSPIEYENIKVEWSAPVPDWLQGTYMKNGPALSEFGGEKRYMNVADGWAKVNKLQVDSTGVTATSKFLKTSTFNKCMDAHEIIPHLTLGAVVPDDWTIGDMDEIGENGSDNTIVTITRMGDEFIAATDLPMVNVFNVSNLEVLELFDPELGTATQPATASSAHFRREPGTDNMLNMHVKGAPGVWETVHLYRYPGGDLRNPKEIGSFHISHSTMIHMFGVTEHYAVFFVYPVHVDGLCAVEHLLHNLMSCITWQGDRVNTDIVVMSLETGRVVSHTETAGLYATHFINAYEEGTNLVADIVRVPWYALANYTDRNAMTSWVDSGSDSNLLSIARYTIDLSSISSHAVTESAWENLLEIPFLNQFDFPVIHPEYEGHKYCYAYGQALVETFRQYLIKKNICDSTQDKIWFRENHYTGEPMFVPRPGATEEDDGVVLDIVLDGEAGESYLLLLDAASWETIAEARLPHIIPMQIHGAWFSDIL